MGCQNFFCGGKSPQVFVHSAIVWELVNLLYDLDKIILMSWGSFLYDRESNKYIIKHMHRIHICAYNVYAHKLLIIISLYNLEIIYLEILSWVIHLFIWTIVRTHYSWSLQYLCWVILKKKTYFSIFRFIAAITLPSLPWDIWTNNWG